VVAVQVPSNSVGALVQVNVTAELNPPTGVTVTGKFSVVPSFVVGVAAGPVSVKSGAVFDPAPVKVIV
jgi:hypothetical protein